MATIDALSTSEAARAAAVSSETIRAWAKQGKLHVRSTPLGILVDPLSLGRLIAAREAAQRDRRGRTHA